MGANDDAALEEVLVPPRSAPLLHGFDREFLVQRVGIVCTNDLWLCKVQKDQ